MNELSKAIAVRFRCVPAGADDPDVRECMERYLAAWGFPSGIRSPADRWSLVTDGAEVVAVVGEKAHPGTRTVEIADLYPGRGRNGILGVYAAVEVLKHLVDGGEIERAFWVSAADNKPHYHALERIFAGGPVAYLWAYGAAPTSAQQPYAQGTAPSEPLSSADSDNILNVGSARLNRAIQEVFRRLDQQGF